MDQASSDASHTRIDQSRLETEHMSLDLRVKGFFSISDAQINKSGDKRETDVRKQQRRPENGLRPRAERCRWDRH